MRKSFSNLFSMCVAMAAIFSIVESANASLITYSNVGTWNSNVTGVSTVTIPDLAPFSYVYYGQGNASVTYSPDTFSQSGTLGNALFFNVGSNYFNGPTAVVSSQQVSVGVENILITFSGSVDAFALNYGTFQGSNVTFTLSNGDTFTQGSTSANGYAVNDFAGATDTTPFNSVLVTSPDYVLNLNNVSTAHSAVPEPSSFALLGLGGLGLAVGAYRRRRAATV